MVALRPYESKAIRAVTGATIRPGGLELTRRTAAYCGLKAGDRVLDVGCGTGATVAFLNRQMGIRAIGVDVSAKLLAEARSKAPNLSVMRANGVALPVRSAAVGAVYCECVLSLISDTMAALVECRRVLQPGGYLVITDLYLRPIALGCNTSFSSSAMGIRGCLEGAVDRPNLEARLTDAGFVVEVWEDHSDRLKRLAAQLVWAGVSIDRWWGTDCDARVVSRQRTGYCLVVAKKG